MNKRHPITAFYIEALILIMVFVGIILLLTQIFGAGRMLSSDADRLTRAVGLAQNAAEAVAASEDLSDLEEQRDEGNIGVSADPSGVSAWYDREGSPKKEGVFRVQTTWEPEEKGGGTLARSHITVWYGEEEEPVYELDTAVYRKGGSE